MDSIHGFGQSLSLQHTKQLHFQRHAEQFNHQIMPPLPISKETRQSLSDMYVNLVQIPSHSFQEEKIRRYCIRYLEKLGIQPAGGHINNDGIGQYTVTSAVASDGKIYRNIIVDIPGSVPDMLIYECHLDQVDPAYPEGVPPKRVNKDGDTIFYSSAGHAQGADNKTAVAASLLAIKYFVMRKTEKKSLPHMVFFFTVCEEAGLLGAQSPEFIRWTKDPAVKLIVSFDREGLPGNAVFIASPGDTRVDITVTVKPSEKENSPLQQVTAQSQAAYKISVKGISGHGAYPENGKSALMPLLGILATISKQVNQDNRTNGLKQLINRIFPFLKFEVNKPGGRLFIDKLQGGENDIYNVIPANAEADIRLTGTPSQIRQGKKRLEQSVWKKRQEGHTVEQTSINSSKSLSLQGLAQRNSQDNINQVLVRGLSTIPNGYFGELNTINTAFVVNPTALKVKAGVDIRGSDSFIDEVVKKLQTAFNNVINKLNNTQVKISRFDLGKGYRISEKNENLQRALRATQQALSLPRLQELKETPALSDLNKYDTKATVPKLLYASAAFNPHQKADPAMGVEGETASLNGIEDIYRIQLALADEYAHPLAG